MKNFYRKYKKWIISVAAIWGILFVAFFANTGFSLVKVNEFLKLMKSDENSAVTSVHWDNSEYRDLIKEKLWLEQQLEMAKTDSFSMGINLRDSIVQVQLKGTVLFQAKIIGHKPSEFFNGSSKESYLNHFAQITRIDASIANIPKRPIKKVIAPRVGQEPETTKQDTIKNERMYWEFVTQNGINIVINGIVMNTDSLAYQISKRHDVFSYRIKNGKVNSFSNEYLPTLFLWLNNQDAKAIYRALPEQAKCIFRN